ncbi:MAG: 3-deoxy-manno-octulosonate cytidylyltransferase [Hydrogenothermaceae bacterium]|nr:3-deoxy-manno-octulosonate cytidylyltransferase [Hydrogenothermaceae bacterium]
MGKSALVIPARRGSTRLPDKLLLNAGDKPVIAHTVENCLRVRNVDRVLVVCDDEIFQNVLKDYPVEVILTPTDLQSGSDRVAYGVKDLDFEFIVNVQGDEPLLDPVDIERVVEELNYSQVVSLYYPIKEEEEYLNPNLVKVVLDKDSYALYFSRSPVPFYRKLEFSRLKAFGYPLKHIGVYGYRKEILMEFSFNMRKTSIEDIEKLEQLRLLYNQYKIKMLKASRDTIGIDTKEDFDKFCTLL